MEDLTSKTVAVFARPFTVPGFDETLPAGEYEIETELVSPPDQKDPEAWKASVLVKLHPRISHPGLAQDPDRFPCRPGPRTRQGQADR